MNCVGASVGLLVGGAWLGAFGGVHRTPGTPLRECPPACGLLLDFAAGSTRCPAHVGTSWGRARTVLVRYQLPEAPPPLLEPPESDEDDDEESDDEDEEESDDEEELLLHPLSP
jgi:hypothetical protein